MHNRSDDTALVTDSPEKCNRLVPCLKICSRKKKLKVNVGKSKVMRCNSEERKPLRGINGVELELENEF